MQVLAGAPQDVTAMPIVQHGSDRLAREIPLPTASSWVKQWAALSAVFDH